MKQIFVTGGKLAIICAFAAIVLGFINSVTEPVIAENQRKAILAALNTISGGESVGEKSEVGDNPSVDYYHPIEEGREGYVVKLTGTGYGGDMDIMAGIRQSGEVFSVLLMDNQETPGLGKKAEADGYMDKYIGTGGDSPVPVSKDQLQKDEADAVSGATITFIGIGQALSDGSNFIKSLGD